MPDISDREFGTGDPARGEIAVAFDEIRRGLPDLRSTAEPDHLQSSFINGIERLLCAW